MTGNDVVLTLMAGNDVILTLVAGDDVILTLMAGSLDTARSKSWRLTSGFGVTSYSSASLVVPIATFSDLRVKDETIHIRSSV